MLLISYICLTQKEILNLEFKKLSLRSVSSSDRRCYCNSDSMYFSHTVGYLEPRSTRQYVHLCDCLHDTEITELFTEQILLGGGDWKFLDVNPLNIFDASTCMSHTSMSPCRHRKTAPPEVLGFEISSWQTVLT